MPIIRTSRLYVCVAPCSGTGEHINMNKIVYSLMNDGQSICTSISQSNINQQIRTILLKLVNVSCHLVYWLILFNPCGLLYTCKCSLHLTATCLFTWTWYKLKRPFERGVSDEPTSKRDTARPRMLRTKEWSSLNRINTDT